MKTLLCGGIELVALLLFGIGPLAQENKSAAPAVSAREINNNIKTLNGKEISRAEMDKYFK